MKHIIVASVLVIIVAALLILGLNAVRWLPGLASAQGALVDQLFIWQIYVIAFIFALIMVFILYAAVVFRRRPGDTSEGPNVKGNVPLEIAWTIIPFIVVMGFGVVSARDLNRMTATAPNELVVDVTGFQFGWRFEYPEQGISSPDLVLPLGRPVLFRITSNDVIHSFWVPEFRIKQDAVPGRWTTLRVTPTELGNYRIRCAEMCGYAHAEMFADVAVVEPDQFEEWLAGKAIEAQPEGELTPAQEGARVAEEKGCLACHSADGSAMVGPTWLGLYGSQRPLEGGSTVTADEAYIRNSILNPTQQVAQGYPNIMPAAYSVLSEEERTAIIEYIKSLGQ